MLVLGVIDSKPSTAAILQDGKILAAVAEERLCRLKMATGVPRRAIGEVLRLVGVAGHEIERVAVAQRISVFQPEPVAWPGWFDGEQPLKTSRLDALGSSLAPIVGRYSLAWQAHHALKGLLFRDRLKKLPRLLKERHGVTAPVRFYDHHYCHATGAYFTSGLRQALVVTLDGGGDGLSGSVYTGKDGKLHRLAGVDSFNSLGNFYSYITGICGFRAERHEGKITGLAAYGEPRYAEILRGLVGYEEPGTIRYRVPMYHRSALRKISGLLPDNFDKADLAASVQLVLEEVGVAFVRHWLRRTGLRDIAVAGGVFANVKLNQRIHELEEIDRFFVHPGMDDGGLAVGSALASLLEERPGAAPELICRLPDVYLGPAYGDRDIERAIEEANCEARREPDIHGTIARLLAEGHVVARFFGRMEYGPRALGGRSILYQAGDPSVNDWLNERLSRTEFMPFAPATLADHAPDCYEGLTGAEDPARFMTITFDCSREMKRQSPGVVHLDGTARPQLVDGESAPDLHAILTAYHRLTGIPSVVNTSFNLHEEPIVCTPADALRAFKDGKLDYLAMHDYLIRHPDAGISTGPLRRSDSADRSFDRRDRSL